jgi:hypothetical protein
MTLKGRSNDSRTNLVGQKQSTTNKINVILEDVLKIKMPAELKLREGLTKDANKTLVNILAAKGYPVPALDFRMKDPSGSGKSLDLRTIMFPDGKSAFVHLNEIFAYGHNDYPDSDKNLLGGYSNKTDISLNKYLLDGLDSLIGTKGNEVPDKGLIKTDVKDERSVALDNEIKRLLSERLAGAKEILMHQFNKQAIEKDTSIDKNLKKTDYWKNAWNKLATGDLR